MAKSLPNDMVEVVRVIHYRGPRDWVNAQIGRSIHGSIFPRIHCSISAQTLYEFPLVAPRGAYDDKIDTGPEARTRIWPGYSDSTDAPGPDWKAPEGLCHPGPSGEDPPPGAGVGGKKIPRKGEG